MSDGCRTRIDIELDLEDTDERNQSWGHFGFRYADTFHSVSAQYTWDWQGMEYKARSMRYNMETDYSATKNKTAGRPVLLTANSIVRRTYNASRCK